MASAELVIVPELAENQMRGVMAKLENQIEKSAKKSKKDWQKNTSDGILGGAKDGLKKAGKLAKSAYSKTSGFRRSVAGGLMGVATAGFFDMIQRADAGSAMIESLLGGENAASQNSAFATNSGFALNQYTQLSRTLQSTGGLQNQEDINAMIFDINARVTEGIQGEDPLLAAFGHLQGADRINAVLAQIGASDDDTRDVTLDRLGFSSDAPAIISALEAVQGGKDMTPAELFKELSKISTGADIDAKALKSEAELAKEFRKQQKAHNDEFKQKFLDEIDSGDIGEFFKDRSRQDNQQLEILKDYKQNLTRANENRVLLTKAMNDLNEFTKKGIDLLGDVKLFAEKWMKDGAIQGAVDKAVAETIPSTDDVVDWLKPWWMD